MGGETGKWGPDGDDGSGVQVTDKFKQKGEGDHNIDEDLPPITQVKKAKQLTGLKTYSITAHPEYQTLFPPGNVVSKGL